MYDDIFMKQLLRKYHYKPSFSRVPVLLFFPNIFPVANIMLNYSLLYLEDMTFFYIPYTDVACYPAFSTFSGFL